MYRYAYTSDPNRIINQGADKKMELSLGAIVNAHGALQFLVNLELSPGASYHVGKNLKVLNDELILYQAEKSKLEERFPDDEDDLAENITALNDTMVKVDIKVLDVRSLGDALIPPMVFFHCAWMFTDNGQG